MPHSFLKPILWNTENYKKPSGIRAGGYPGEKGFGHEEWNNSDRLLHDGVRYFYTNEIKYDGTDSVILLMYASHDKIQELVGIAGKAKFIGHSEEQNKLRSKLIGEEFLNEAWQTSTVKTIFENNFNRFKSEWNSGLKTNPNWACPDEYFLWLDKPVQLDANAIAGKTKLLTMFSRWTPINIAQTKIILNEIPKNSREEKWQLIWNILDGGESELNKSPSQAAKSDLIDDLLEIQARTQLKETVRKQLIAARIGQGDFRKEVKERWGSACAVSGSKVDQVLQACHLKPWRSCNDNERLDPANGILLTANLHALFDAGMIMFEGSGKVKRKGLKKEELDALGIFCKLQRPLDDIEKAYLNQRT